MNLDFQYLFTSFDGSINRAKCWAGMIILAVVSIVLGFMIVAIFGLSFFARPSQSFSSRWLCSIQAMRSRPNASKTATSPASSPFMAWFRC